MTVLHKRVTTQADEFSPLSKEIAPDSCDLAVANGSISDEVSSAEAMRPFLMTRSNCIDEFLPVQTLG